MVSKKWIFPALVLGAVFFIAIWAVKPIGVSTQFSVVTGAIHSTIDSTVIQKDENAKSGYSSTNEYYNKSGGSLAKNIKNLLNYDFIFVLAIFGGAFAGYFLNRKRTNKLSDDAGESCPLQADKKGVIATYLPSFISGFLLLYGARMADGCTSGHMMSGMMQGAVSGYIFAGAVFLSAIITAVIAGRINSTKGVN